ncbi:hypothetical protein CSW38_06765 [Thermus scotoductus]|uniref:Uncharacterized protein n=1 Tax=Thermus scotoductus TaxID=37636 RepID=A0A430RY93_THESC|nr:hypothetical protein CSW38_06765 [Thermus scotoductus]
MVAVSQVFPPSGVVAVAGSRHGSPWPVSPVVQLVVASGGVVRVGDQRGVDAAVRAACPSAVVVRAGQFPGPPAARLHQRTRAVVLGHPRLGLPPASVLVVFPPVGGAPALGPGSSLALRLAVGAGLPVWVAGDPRPAGPGWAPLSLAGVPGWVLYPVQSQLFSF